MLQFAQQKAQAERLKNLFFVEANAVDLSQFENRQFDLVLNMDGPLAWSGALAETALRESARVTRQTLVVTAPHRAWAIPALLRGERGFEKLRSFLPHELREVLAQCEMKVFRAGGFGSLVTLVGEAYVQTALQEKSASDAFLEECEQFDQNILPDGPGTPDDTGLMIVATREPSGTSKRERFRWHLPRFGPIPFYAKFLDACDRVSARRLSIFVSSSESLPSTCSRIWHCFC